MVKSRRRLSALCLTLVIQGSPARAVDYEPISLACVLAAAETVVVARVSDHSGREYEFEVRQHVAGERIGGSDLLLISPWQGDAERPPGLAVLFLRRADRKVWEVVGPSAEGWFPIGRGVVKLMGIAPLGISDPTLASLRDAVRGLPRCVRWQRNVPEGWIRATVTCDRKALETLKRSSAFSRRLIEAVLRTRAPTPCLALPRNDIKPKI